jgi:Divergent InlB B-repeat domain
MKPIITTRTWKLFVALLTFAAAPAFPQEEATLLLRESRAVSLTVRKGKPSGRYAAGTEVTVRADVPPSGAHFTIWIGNVQILADSRSAITTAIVPFTPVTITATYSADSQDPAMGHSGRGCRDRSR